MYESFQFEEPRLTQLLALWEFVEGPVLESVLNPKDRNPDQVQVTWSCFPNSYYPNLELTESERRVLLHLEAVLASISPNEAVEFVSGLQSVLQEQAERDQNQT